MKSSSNGFGGQVFHRQWICFSIVNGSERPLKSPGASAPGKLIDTDASGRTLESIFGLSTVPTARRLSSGSSAATEVAGYLRNLCNT
jgi:hypothetical protein